MPTVSLFIPCLVEHVYPQVGLSAARVLERAGIQVEVPPGQTCCGQPPYKQGRINDAASMARRFLDVFQGAEAVVGPTASCVAMIRQNYPDLLAEDKVYGPLAEDLAQKTFELSEYLVNRLGLKDTGASLPGKAVYHESCQMGRVLGLKEEPRLLLDSVRSLEILPFARQDRCCGMGGQFSYDYPELSAELLEDKMADIQAASPDYVITAEVSCMLNLDGYVRKHGLPLRVLHLAQVLDSAEGKNGIS